MLRFSVISTSATFSMNAVVTSVSEGNQIIITLETTGVQHGQTLPYTISGDGISIGDFTGIAELTGSVVVQNGVAQIVLNTNIDQLIETVEHITVTVGNVAYITIDLLDVQLTPTSYVSLRFSNYWIVSTLWKAVIAMQSGMNTLGVGTEFTGSNAAYTTNVTALVAQEGPFIALGADPVYVNIPCFASEISGIVAAAGEFFGQDVGNYTAAFPVMGVMRRFFIYRTGNGTFILRMPVAA